MTSVHRNPDDPVAPAARQYRLTETKDSYKTSELVAYVAAVIGVLIASAIVDDHEVIKGHVVGGFGAQQAWLYITILTAAYCIGRGLAKSGTPDRYPDND